MKKERRQINRNPKTPLLGMGVVIMSSFCLFLILYLVMIVTRLALG